jgi:phosphoribosylglycinamide formyltransferase-1
MAALLYASRAEDCPYEVALVTGDRPEASGLALAEAEGVPVERPSFDKATFFDSLDALLRARHIEVIALAGFMRILPASLPAPSTAASAWSLSSVRTTSPR